MSSDNNNKPSQELKDKWQNDPANFEPGVFYYNKEDKRIFPQKISGLGWTTNFANSNSILAIVGIVVALLIIIILVNQ